MDCWFIFWDYPNHGIMKNGNIISFRYKKPKTLKPILDRYGYHYVFLCKNGRKKVEKIHRLVAKAWLFNCNKKPEVDHINKIRTDNRLENLKWATSKENKENHNANGSIYKNHSLWQAEWYQKPYMRKWERFKTKEEAEKWLKEMKIIYPRTLNNLTL